MVVTEEILTLRFKMFKNYKTFHNLSLMFSAEVARGLSELQLPLIFPNCMIIIDPGSSIN